MDSSLDRRDQYTICRILVRAVLSRVVDWVLHPEHPSETLAIPPASIRNNYSLSGSIRSILQTYYSQPKR